MEQYQLFLYTKSYLVGLLYQPGGFSEYLSAYIMQFFYLPTLAAVCLTLLLGAILLAFQGFIRRCGAKRMEWMAFVPLLLLLVYPQESLTVGVSLFLGVSAAFGYSLIRPDRIRYGVGALLIVVLYFLSTPAHLLFALLLALYEGCTGKEVAGCWVGVGALLGGLLLPLLAMRTVYILPMREVWLSRYLSHPEQPLPVSLALIGGAFPVCALLAYGLRNRKALFKRVLFNRLLLSGMLVGVLVWGILYVRHPLEQAYRYDYYARHSQWDQIVKHARTYAVRDQDALRYLNLALSYTGQFNDALLQYPQLGQAGLIPYDPRTRLGLIEASEVAWQLNHVNSAQRFAFVGVLSSERCVQPRLMKRLVETYLVNEEYKAAEKYIKILEATHFYRGWAVSQRALLNPMAPASADWLVAKRRFPVKTDNPYDLTKGFTSALAYMLDDHPDNRVAFEYAMGYLLLYKDLNVFMHYMEQMRDAKQPLPVLYQEAVCLFYAAVQSDPEAFKSYSINPEVYARFRSFLQMAGSLPPDALSRQYGNTYYYYAQFVPTPKQVQE